VRRAFDRNNAVCNNKVSCNGWVDIEDALLNAFPVEDILWLSVSFAGYAIEHVLHAECHAGIVSTAVVRKVNAPHLAYG